MTSLFLAMGLSKIWARVLGYLIPIALVAGGLWYLHHTGYQKGLQVSKEEIKSYEQKLEDLKKQKQQVQTVIDEKIVVEYRDRVKTVEKVVYRNVEVPVPSQYLLSKGWIATHDATVEGKVVSPAEASDPAPSTKTDAEILQGTIIPNYGMCMQWREQVIAWQNWYTETKKNYEEHTK